MSKCTRCSGKRQDGVSDQHTDESLRKRIREVGPDKFGLLVVDTGKKHYAVRLTNFFEDTLWEPDPVSNNRIALEKMMDEVENTMQENGLTELMVGIERTGRLHEPAKQVLEKKWPVRMIHPFTTKQLRQPASAGIKTDPVDLTAQQRAMICGYGTEEAQLPEQWLELRYLSRERRNLVSKRSTLKTQAVVQMESLFPGYSELFHNFWRNPAAAALIEAYPCAESILAADNEQIVHTLSESGTRCLRSTVERVRSWANQASPPDRGKEINHRILCDYLALIRELTTRIDHCEKALLQRLVQTPAVLLLSITGVNVPSASNYAGEMGPHEHYIGPEKVTGRAGIFPSHYQSDETNRPNGPVVGGRNSRLRDAILDVSRNLITRNPYFHAWRNLPDHKNWTYQHAEAAVGNHFARISFAMLRQNNVFDHPIAGRQDSVLCKLLAFGREKKVPTDQLYEFASCALQHLPQDALPLEQEALFGGGWDAPRKAPRPQVKPRGKQRKTPEYVNKIIADIQERITRNKGETVTQSV